MRVSGGGPKGAATFLILGGYTLLVQVLLLRECFTLFAGNELSVAIQLGLWLVFTGIGGIVGSGLGSTATARLLLALPCLGLWGVLAVRVLPLILPVPIGDEIPFGWAVLSLLVAQAPLNASAGALFPAACRTYAPEDPASIGRFYRFEATGAGFAGVLFTLVLSQWARTVTMAVAASAVVGLIIVTVLPRRYRIAAAATGVLFLSLSFADPADRLDRWWWAVRHPGSELLDTVESHYQRLDLARRAGQHTILANGAPTVTLEDEEELTSGSRGADLYLSFHDSPRQVLIVGAGAPALLERMLDYPSIKTTYVLRDPAVLHIVEPLTSVWNDPRVSVVHTDGRLFLNNAPGDYDLIVLDLPPPATAAGNRFFTVEAFQAARRHLRPNGVLAFSLPSSGHYLAGENELLLASVNAALRTAFSETFLLAGDSMVFGGGRARPKLAELADRFAERDVSMQLASGRRIEDEAAKKRAFAALYAPLFQQFRYEQQAESLQNMAIEPNSDAKPLVYYLNLRRWARAAGWDSATAVLDRCQGMLSAVGRHSLPILLAGLVCAGLFGLGARTLPLQRGLMAFAIFISGAAGMLGQIVLLLIYQDSYGQLYRAVGALFALYMFGLAVGSTVSSRAGRTRRSRFRVLLALRISMAAICAGAAYGAAEFPVPMLALALFTYAFLLGFEFPLANRIYSADLAGKRAAGLLYGMDNSGAALAVFIGGVLLIPLLGPVTTLLAITSVHALVFAALFPLLLSAISMRGA